jgi:hypothetical protein
MAWQGFEDATLSWSLLAFFSVIWASFFAVDSNSDTPLLRYVGKNTRLHFDFDLT